MGNLLGAPVVDKETHEGVTSDGLLYGVSSMQGWRVHMEDAHITERRLYASECVEENGTQKYSKIDLPGHSLFAIFDGHGGTFAAAYAGRNLCRVLSRQPKFVEYAKFERDRPQMEKTFTSSTDRAHYIRHGLDLLETALCHAFIELDREIALALRGNKVEGADEQYLDDDSQHNIAMDTEGHHHDAMQGVTSVEEENPADSALKLLEEEGDSGTTACVVLLTPDYIFCANAGDSRAVISRLGNKSVPLSFDHKPDDEDEERRIRSAGGYVAGGRVEGDLAVSRGLGDFRFKNMDVVMASTSAFEQDTNHPEDEPTTQRHVPKPGEQKVSPVPDITIQSRNHLQDEFIIIACDGIWDVQTNYEAVQMVADMFKEGETSLGLICEEVCDTCLSMGSKDNMTALVIKLESQKVGEGGGVVARRQRREAEHDEKHQKDDERAYS